MKRKDYVEIANVIRNLNIGTLANTCMGGFEPSLFASGYHCETLIDSFCDLFEGDSSRFNKKKFIEACGFEAWEKLIMGVPTRGGKTIGGT